MTCRKNNSIIKVDNKSSSNIPGRLGFKFEGIERQGELLSGGIFTDLAVYSKLKSDLPFSLKKQ